MNKIKTRLVSVTGYEIMVFIDGSDNPVLFEKNSNGKYDLDEISMKHPKWTAIATWPVYDTESGQLEPGCMYFYGKDVYSEPHLIVVLPGGHHWDIDSRASNCTLPEDDDHKCWIRHGTPPEITVDKNGNTCSAGSGSIMMGGYHGFLRNGYLEDCN